MQNSYSYPDGWCEGRDAVEVCGGCCGLFLCSRALLLCAVFLLLLFLLLFFFKFFFFKFFFFLSVAVCRNKNITYKSFAIIIMGGKFKLKSPYCLAITPTLPNPYFEVQVLH